MKFIRNLIVLLLIAVGTLYFTNPDQEASVSYTHLTLPTKRIV